MDGACYSGSCTGALGGSIACAACMFSYDTTTHFLLHLRDCAADDLHKNCTFQCAACSNYFAHPTAFLVHLQGALLHPCQNMLPVTNEKRMQSQSIHDCVYCEKVFCRPADLKRHLTTHTGERPFACAECGRCFKIKSTLDGHRKTHTTPTKHINCTVCKKRFLSQSALRLHMRVHTNEAPFACTTPGCRETFRTRKLMLSHQRRGVCGVDNSSTPDTKGSLLVQSLSEVVAIKRPEFNLKPSENSAFSLVGAGKQHADSQLPTNHAIQERQIVVRTVLRSGSVVAGAFYGGSFSAPSTDVVMDVSTLRNLSADGYVLSMPLKKMGLHIELVLLLDPTAILARLSPQNAAHFSAVVCPTNQSCLCPNQPVSIVISEAESVQIRHQLPSFLVECFSAHTYVEQNRQVLVQSCLPMIEAPRAQWNVYGQNQ